jgi:hypothetical protein
MPEIVGDKKYIVNSNYSNISTRIKSRMNDSPLTDLNILTKENRKKQLLNSLEE